MGLGKFGLPRSKDQEKARTAKTETHNSMVPEVQSCGHCETTLATIQSLDRLVPILEKIFEQLSKQSTLPQESLGTESVESLATEEEGKKLMEMFNKMLVDCVLFALPQVLIFFPRYEVKSIEESNQRLSLLKITQDAGGSSFEKSVVISFFVIFVTVWFLGLLLSQFGRGHHCTSLASVFTACAAICTIAFVDYSLCKCLPEDTLYLVLFALHFAVMVVGIGYVWCTYINIPQLPTIKWPLHVHVEPKDKTQEHLLTHENEIA